MNNTCIYPGSFDPITLGHLDIIERACRLFDRVIVAVLHNPAKTGCLPVEERMALIRECCVHLPQVEVRTWTGLTVELAQAEGATALVRGLRTNADFEAEHTLALLNHRLAPELETVLLFSQAAHSDISSSAAREIASYGGPLTGMVPDVVAETLYTHYGKSHPTGVA